MPGDTFKREVLDLRKGDILSRVASLKDYSLQPDIQLEDIPVIRDEVKNLKAEIQPLKVDIFKHNASVKEVEGSVDISELSCIDNDFREILRTCNAIETRLESKKDLKLSESSIPIALEKFSLFIFDGDISKWSSWFSLFNNAIDKNPNLSPTQKFLYLKKYLSGEPLAICDQFETTDYNYADAILLLKNRYQNERRLGSYYLNQLLNYNKKDSGNEHSKFLTTHRSSIAALKNLKEITDLNDFCFFHITYNNLDTKMQNAFDMSRARNSKIPKLDELLNFVEFAATNQELKMDLKCETKKEDFKSRYKYSGKTLSKQAFVGMTESKTKTAKSSQDKTCPCCSEFHKLYLCEKFKSQSADRRNDLVRQWRRCFNCLGAKHDPCPSSFSCLVCKKPHHTLLHRDSAASSDLVGCAFHQKKKQVLLGTITCEVQDNFNSFIPIRVLLDSGAQSSVVTYELVKRLRIPLNPSSVLVRGITATKLPSMGIVSLRLRSSTNNESVLKITAIVLKKNLSGNLPAADVPLDIKNKFRHLKLADPDFIKSAKIDLILGADAIPEILFNTDMNIYKDEETGLIAQNTIFGFVIQGAVPEFNAKGSPGDLLSPIFVGSSSLEENMEKFWQSEEVISLTHDDPDDVYCERLFTSTTQRLPDGRFCVRLPFKPGAFPANLKNRCFALASYKNLERRLNKDQTLLEQYKEQITSYLELGHMVRCSYGTASYIMPQLVVLRKSALTTRLRVCFNASSVAFAGLDQPRSSLNDMILPGPKLQADLNSILTRFRLNEVGMIADVEMMFRRIEVSLEDRKYLHIFFRESPDAELEELELNVLPFGLRCSPFLAQRVVQELLDSEGHHFPEASKALRSSLYVDDFVGSFSSVEKATEMRKQLSQLMQKGGFTLRKWASSHPEVLEETSAENNGKICFTDECRTVKVLGLQWDAMDDCFTYKTLAFTSPVTKRACLSYIARTFDCLGLVSPVVFWMKLFLQKLWTIKVDWDEPLPEDLVERWSKFTLEIHSLAELRIPRCIRRSGEADIFLACFSDGSQVGYAACIYLVSRYPAGNVVSNLLIAKSKLAPLATISIPRLELNGALLMAQLCHHIIPALDELKIKHVYLFTDSEIVLAWVRTPPFRLKTYVANRISKIQHLTKGMTWGHISTLENPSDFATRGLFPSQLLNNPLWWAGPKMLQFDPSSWSSSSAVSELEVPELKESTILLVDQAAEENPIYEDLILRHSNLGKLQRVLAYLLRFRYNAQRPPPERRVGPLQVFELEESLKKCLIIAQYRDFSEDIKNLKKHKQPSKRLLKLNPFLDNDGVVRVGGRLSNSLLPMSEKHPILLSKDSHFAKLVCNYYHQILLHAGPRTTRAVIQRKFWIISIHSLLRKLIFRCTRCMKWQAKPAQPQMGDLPHTRVRPSRCFASTTMDMAGPFTVSETRRRKSPQHKAYVCVFVCEATKAVHLEAVTELSTSAFLAAFNRFVSRRSLPHLLRSDNGRNFIGARRILKECQTFLQEHSDEICSALSSRQVNWKLNPAYSPHFGGLHEAAVKSAKLIFYKTVGNAILTLEEFTTLLTRIEAVLNSRPLGFFSPDPNEGTDYLSPGHFLVGGPLVATPEEPLDLQSHPRTRWIMVQQMSQSFWKRFHYEYLHSLMTREKWVKGSTEFNVGQLVYVTGEKTSPLLWPLGRIVEIYPGADGKVRVVDVKIGSAVFRRSVHKLIIVPVDSEF